MTEENPGAGAASGRGASAEAYWSRNLRYVTVLLAIWFAVSYGAGILFVEQLNQIRIPFTGFPLGFWFAQQGSIYVFVVLIFVYVALMNRLDREYEVDEGEVE
jgi:putative solute:sodium symporter small subunit